MTLVTYEPWRNLTRMQGEMTRMMRDALGSRDTEAAIAGTFAPPVDIFEHGDELVLLADLPGIEKDSIDVSIENRTLSLTAERARSSESEEMHSYRAEREHGRFVRTFSLPISVDPTRVSATYHDGVLRVTIPKAEEAKPRKIQVKTA